MSTLSVLAAPEAWCLVSLQHTGPDSNFSPKNRNPKQPLGGVWDPAGILADPVPRLCAPGGTVGVPACLAAPLRSGMLLTRVLPRWAPGRALHMQ